MDASCSGLSALTASGSPGFQAKVEPRIFDMQGRFSVAEPQPFLEQSFTVDVLLRLLFQ